MCVHYGHNISIIEHYLGISLEVRKNVESHRTIRKGVGNDKADGRLLRR